MTLNKAIDELLAELQNPNLTEEEKRALDKYKMWLFGIKTTVSNNTESNPFHFQLSDKLYKWIRKHEEHCHSHTTAGEHFKISFIPTGIVECQEVECLICGEKEKDYID